MNRDRAGVVDATILRLLLASFVVALSTTGFIFAVPFYVLEKLGRTDVVGQVVATWTVGYIITCLLAQQITRLISPRLLVTLATAGVSLFIFLFRLTSTVQQMSVIAVGYGLCLGLFWAPLMGWLSGNAEGVTLSRRLGLFNIAWSSSIIIAPLVTGYLVKHSLTLPFVVMTGVMVAACLVVLTTRYRALGTVSRAVSALAVTGDHGSRGDGCPARENDTPSENDDGLDPRKMQYIRYLGWAGALVAYMAIGVYRYQMPHLAKTVAMDEVVYGRVATALSLAITLAFFVTARWIGWHGKTRWIFLPQVLLVIVSVLLAWATTAWTLGPLMLAAGFAAGLLYASSVFYGSLGAPANVRTRRMAIHEICLNVGVILGSYFGNLLSQQLGPSRVYPYLAIAIALIVVTQFFLWNLSQRWRRPNNVAHQAVSLGLKPVLTKQQ